MIVTRLSVQPDGLGFTLTSSACQ